MGLIDTDVLFAQMKAYYEKQVEEANITGNRVVCVTWDDAIILIKNTPIADAVPVVRCEKCLKKRLCILYRETNDENGFCVWAGRKDTDDK